MSYTFKSCLFVRMRIEKIILAVAGVFAGLFVAGIAFYIYQTTKTISPSSIQTITVEKPTPSASPVPLVVSEPSDNAVLSSRVVDIKGKTDAKATLIISIDSGEKVVSPSGDGSFDVNLTLASGENRVIILSVMPDGSETQQTLAINVTSEDF